MNIHEHQLEQVIYDTFHQDRYKLNTYGLPLKEGNLHKQVHLGSYGRCDLVHSSLIGPKHILVSIIELKKEVLDTKALTQAYRYISGFHSGTRYVPLDPSIKLSYKAILIGSSVHPNLGLIGSYNPDIELYTYRFGIDTGLRFKLFESYSYKNYTSTNKPIEILYTLCNLK